jgi:acetyl esterase/lipase
MTLDPQMKQIIDMIAAAGAPSIRGMTAPEARTAFEGRLEFFRRGGVAAVERCEDRTVPGPDGPIPVRLYYPRGQSPCGAAMFFHGGGWVLGNLDSHDPTCRALAAGSGALIIAVDYRLAPEHKFPAAADDSYAATQWAGENAATLGYPAGRLAVCGDSAGGNLAAVAALMARDRGGPALRYQLLIYPAFDPAMEAPSHREFAQDGYVLSSADMAWFWNHYLRNAQDGSNPYVNPARVSDLSRLPPALVITAGFDPLRDEGEAYAESLRKAGVPVTARRFEGLTHGFFNMTSQIDQARAALDQTCGALRTALTQA